MSEKGTKLTCQFDLTQRAPNGLRRGFTTGSCATAAVKAALILLREGEVQEKVQITLPDNEHFLELPVSNAEYQQDGSVIASVIKDAGDDPDNTDGAVITAIVKTNNLAQIRFLAGMGVGIVTEPGIRIPIGEPAINPIPREMIRRAISEVLEDEAEPGLDITIGCINGEEIAKRTFNPRLGIKGGISIIGTTGIIEPMSLAAYMASVEVYVRVALGNFPPSIALLPGNIGTRFCRENLQLPKKRVVNISNFLGFALESTEKILQESNTTLEALWVLGHPGKLAKVLNQEWDTHSSRSKMAMEAIAQVARDCDLPFFICKKIAESNTVEAIVELLIDRHDAARLWAEIEKRTSLLMHKHAPSVKSVEVRLFSMNGTALSIHNK